MYTLSEALLWLCAIKELLVGNTLERRTPPQPPRARSGSGWGFVGDGMGIAMALALTGKRRQISSFSETTSRIDPSFGECPACHQGRMLVIEILHCFGRQVELRRASLAGQATGALQPRGPLRTLSKGQMLSADAVISHSTRRKPSRQSPTLTACGPLQILARDPAGNQYT